MARNKIMELAKKLRNRYHVFCIGRRARDELSEIERRLRVYLISE
jgi:hypothetical protein